MPNTRFELLWFKAALTSNLFTGNEIISYQLLENIFDRLQHNYRIIVVLAALFLAGNLFKLLENKCILLIITLSCLRLCKDFHYFNCFLFCR